MRGATAEKEISMGPKQSAIKKAAMVFRRSAKEQNISSGVNFQFKQIHSEAERKREAEMILQRYPNRLPVIVERAPKANVPSMEKQKFLVPDNISVAQFMWTVRRRIHLSAEKALFLFVGKYMPQSSLSMGELYEMYKDSDGFLYLSYSGESTFG